MAVTVIDNAALVVLDLQVATAALPSTPNSAPEIIERSTQLANAFRDKGHSVIWVTVDGGVSGRIDNQGEAPDLPTNWADLLPELDVQPADKTLAKQAWGAFHDDRLHSMLQELKVDQVVLTGVTTSFAVESTARAAYERNYNVVVVSDAIGDLDLAAHENSVTRIFPEPGRGGHRGRRARQALSDTESSPELPDQVPVHDALAQALHDNGVRDLFGVLGDANLHIIDEFARLPGAQYVGMAAEGGAVLAALGYAQVSGTDRRRHRDPWAGPDQHRHCPGRGRTCPHPTAAACRAIPRRRPTTTSRPSTNCRSYSAPVPGSSKSSLRSPRWPTSRPPSAERSQSGSRLWRTCR